MLLVETAALGSGQTISSQGILHGGLKYTLSGHLTGAAQQVREMPARWMEHLTGRRSPDLGRVTRRADFCYLWRSAALRSRLAMIGARAGLRSASEGVADDERPAALRDCPGTVARVVEPVLEPASLLAELAAPLRGRLIRADGAGGVAFHPGSNGKVWRVTVTSGGEQFDLRSQWLIFAAGAGNGALRRAVGLESGAMQTRPLHMVMARGDLPVLNGHCVDGMETRVTVTTTRDSTGRCIWQIGGRLAERGVSMTQAELVHLAKREIEEVIPAAPREGIQWSSWKVDRAELRTASGVRPDGIGILQEAPGASPITVWPTKMVLAPHLADEVLRRVAPPVSAERAAPTLPFFEAPGVATPPWDEADRVWTALP